MPSAAFTTLGCKVNQYETQKILESFEEAGFAIVPFDSPADVYVINSCSVTSAAESKSRYTIRRATRNNPASRVVVTGCAAQMAVNKGETIMGVDVLVPNTDKLKTISWLFRSFPELENWVRAEPAVRNPVSALGRTRATLKIQDGCNVYCSYCSIPFTRPGLKSRPVLEVLDEARKMIDMGHREIVLTGVLIGAFGPESGSDGPDFEELIERLASLDQTVRLRISSIEMRQVTPRIVSLIQEGLVVPHLHIPLQSGDSEVLRDMNRPYSQNDYLNLCSRLYDAVPEITLTTDIMVGFPTESPERFKSSVHVCREARFVKTHVFRFSPRFGTPADAWGDPIPDSVKQRRSEELHAITMISADSHGKRFVGQVLRVLVEGKERKDGLLEGLSDNYLDIRFAGPKSLMREFAWVRIVDWAGQSGLGELAAAPSSNRRLLPMALA